MQTSTYQRLPVFAFLIGASAVAQAKDYLDLPFTAHEHEAAYTARSADGLTLSYVSSAIYIPGQHASRDPNSCQTTDKPSGAVCFKLAGGGATVPVASLKYFWRPSHRGHDTAWLPCELANGCTAYDTQVYPDGRTVTSFRVWTSMEASVSQADFRVDITFAAIPTPPVVAKPSAAERIYSRWQEKLKNSRYN